VNKMAKDILDNLYEFANSKNVDTSTAVDDKPKQKDIKSMTDEEYMDYVKKSF
jgi:hypothetical protein